MVGEPREGTNVVIQQLRGRPHLNGRIGTLVPNVNGTLRDKGSNRCRVHLRGTPFTVKVGIGNISAFVPPLETVHRSTFPDPEKLPIAIRLKGEDQDRKIADPLKKPRRPRKLKGADHKACSEVVSDPMRLRNLGLSFFRDKNLEEHPVSVAPWRMKMNHTTSRPGYDWRDKGMPRYLHPNNIPAEYGGLGPSVQELNGDCKVGDPLASLARAGSKKHTESTQSQIENTMRSAGNLHRRAQSPGRQTKLLPAIQGRHASNRTLAPLAVKPDQVEMVYQPPTTPPWTGPGCRSEWNADGRAQQSLQFLRQSNTLTQHAHQSGELVFQHQPGKLLMKQCNCSVRHCRKGEEEEDERPYCPHCEDNATRLPDNWRPDMGIPKHMVAAPEPPGFSWDCLPIPEEQGAVDKEVDGDNVPPASGNSTDSTTDVCCENTLSSELEPQFSWMSLVVEEPEKPKPKLHWNGINPNLPTPPWERPETPPDSPSFSDMLPKFEEIYGAHRLRPELLSNTAAGSQSDESFSQQPLGSDGKASFDDQSSSGDFHLETPVFTQHSESLEPFEPFEPMPFIEPFLETQPFLESQADRCNETRLPPYLESDHFCNESPMESDHLNNEPSLESDLRNHTQPPPYLEPDPSSVSRPAGHLFEQENSPSNGFEQRSYGDVGDPHWRSWHPFDDEKRASSLRNAEHNSETSDGFISSAPSMSFPLNAFSIHRRRLQHLPPRSVASGDTFPHADARFPREGTGGSSASSYGVMNGERPRQYSHRLYSHRPVTADHECTSFGATASRGRRPLSSPADLRRMDYPGNLRVQVDYIAYMGGQGPAARRVPVEVVHRLPMELSTDDSSVDENYRRFPRQRSFELPAHFSNWGSFPQPADSMDGALTDNIPTLLSRPRMPLVTGPPSEATESHCSSAGPCIVTDGGRMIHGATSLSPISMIVGGLIPHLVSPRINLVPLSSVGDASHPSSAGHVMSACDPPFLSSINFVGGFPSRTSIGEADTAEAGTP